MTEEHVRKKTLEYFNQDILATDAWINKYALRNEKGEILEETPDDMHRRLTKEFYRMEQKYHNPMDEDEIYNLLKGFKYFIPAGSSMYGIGNPYSMSSLGNCFVIGSAVDSYGGIFFTDQEQGQLMKRRAGVGHDISNLRPAKTPVTNAAGTSTGAVSFMSRFSNTTREVGQGGRRGALMLTINISHPDAEKFVTSKDDVNKITGANISVKITDNFMKAVKNDETYDQYFNFSGTIKTINIKARPLWDKIIHQAWKNAEPGVLFWDKIIKESPADLYPGFKTIATNPCGELPLPPYDSCRLGHINLYSYVVKPFTKNATFNDIKFKQDVQKAQRLMDDIIDLEEEKINAILNKIDMDPEPGYVKKIERNIWRKIKDNLLKGRRTGLGITALGDMLAALNYKYGTDEANKFVNKIFKMFATSSYMSSIQMAEERGAFPIFDLDIEEQVGHPYLDRILSLENSEMPDKPENDPIIDYQMYGRRNIANLTIAPTGTTSLMTQTSSGIEPIFQIQYRRRRKVENDYPNRTFQDDNGDWWEEYNIFHKGFLDWFKTNQDIPAEFPSYEVYLKQLEQVTLDYYIFISPYYQATANEIDYDKKIEMQGIIQKWIDHSISVTHNLPKNISKEEVSRLYMKAWEEGCKGITIYRQGSRDGVLLENNDSNNVKFEDRDAPKRPKELQCDIYHPTIKGEKYIVLVGVMDDKPYEVFAFKKNGIFCPDHFTKGILKKQKRGIYHLLNSDKQTVIENIASKFKKPEQEDVTRLLSWGLRHGGGIKHAVEQLNVSYGNLMDYSKVIARQLKRYIPDGDKATGISCPECGSENFKYESGCLQCIDCGWTKC